MSFDANTYQQLNAVNPAAAAAYLQATIGVPAGVSPVMSATPPPPAAPVAQGQYVNPAALQPAPQLARGTLEDFYSQPTGAGGGPAVTSKFFNKRPQESWLDMEVTADVTNADVRQQTTPQGIPQIFKDGRPKFVLVVKVNVLASSDGTHPVEFPDGLGSLWIKGALADELRRAMAAAGDASGYPKAKARIVMVSKGEQASRTPGFSPTKLYQLQYAAPAQTLQQTAQAASGFSPADPTPALPAAPPATVPGLVIASSPAAPAAPVLTTIPAAVTPAPPVVTSAVPTAAVPTAAPAVSAPLAPDFAPPAPPALGEDKAALLARLQGMA